jgi:hypothetical protein
VIFQADEEDAVLAGIAFIWHGDDHQTDVGAVLGLGEDAK